MILLNEREQFEEHRYCMRCGRRLRYAAWVESDRYTAKPATQWLSKRCPLDGHDFIGHSHPVRRYIQLQGGMAVE